MMYHSLSALALYVTNRLVITSFWLQTWEMLYKFMMRFMIYDAIGRKNMESDRIQNYTSVSCIIYFTTNVLSTDGFEVLFWCKIIAWGYRHVYGCFKYFLSFHVINVLNKK